MTRPHHACASALGVNRNAHRRHERSRAKNAAEIMIHGFHDPGWRVVFYAAMMKKEFRQSGKQRSRGSVAGAICDPKQNSALLHRQPTVDITAHLDYRAITGGNLPTGQSRGLVRNQGLLGQARSGQIALEITTPFFEFIVLPL